MAIFAATLGSRLQKKHSGFFQETFRRRILIDQAARLVLSGKRRDDPACIFDAPPLSLRSVLQVILARKGNPVQQGKHPFH
jgi:hypothetical protein